MKTLLVLSLTLLINITLVDFVTAGDKAVNSSLRSDADLARDKTSKPTEIMAFLGVNKGDHVLDFLGGAGYYSQLLAEKVGSSGEVVHQTNKAYLSFVGKKLDERIAKGGLDKVTRLLSEADDLKLGENRFDSAILVLGYHDFFFSDGEWNFPSGTVIPQLHKSLKKGGKLLIIDHAAIKGKGKSVTKLLHRIEGDFVKRDIKIRGFKFVKETDILRNDKDPRDITVFDPKIRGNTDRFVYLFQKD